MASSTHETHDLLPFRQSRRGFLGVLALGLSVPILSACGDSSDDGTGSSPGASASGSSGALQDMIFLSVIPLPSISNAAELIADTGGFFKKRGLEVEFQATQGSPQAIQTLIAGSALMTRIGDIETITSIATKNAPLVNLGEVEKKGLLRFMSSKRKPLMKPEDFRGATMGLPSLGGTSEKTLNLVLASAGIPDSAVKRQVVGLAPGVFELVKSGRIDGYVVSLDTSLALLAQQPEALAFAPSSTISAGSQLYATSTKQAEDPQKQDQIRRFLQAIADAIHFIIEDEKNGFKETMRLMGSKYEVPVLKDPEIAAAALKLFIESWTADGADKVVQTNPKTWQAAYDEMVKSKLVPAGGDPSKWMTAEFAPSGS